MRTHQRSFGGAEVAPEMFGRIDLHHFQIGVERCRNFITRPSGPAENRSGFEFIKEAKDGGPNPVRLLPFIFNTDQAYILEFGDFYMRVHTEGATILETAQNITAATNADPVMVTVTGHGYAAGDEVFINGVGGMTELNGRFFKIKNPLTDTFELTDLQGNNINGLSYTPYTSGGTSACVYTLATPYPAADLFQLKFEQSADVVTITHKSYAPRELRRMGATNWAFNIIDWKPSIEPPITVASVADVGAGGGDSIDYDYQVTAIDEDIQEESLPARGIAIGTITKSGSSPLLVTAVGHTFSNGDRIRITEVEGMTGLNGTSGINGQFYDVLNPNTDTFELSGTDSSNFTNYVSGGFVSEAVCINDLSKSGANNTIGWEPVTNAIRYNVYKLEKGLYGYIGQTSDLEFVDDNITPDVLQTPPFDPDPFYAANHYPGTVAYHDQRRCLASSNDLPQAIWMTRSGTESNLTKSIPSQDDNAITVRLKSRQHNSVRHLVSLNDLMVFTNNNEWRLSTGNSDALTPTTVNIKVQSHIGSADVRPLVVGDSTLFIADKGNHVHTFNFSFERDKYKPDDISLVAPHLIDGFKVLDWDYSRYPNSTVWCVRSDGKLLGCTYLPDQQPIILGWHRHDTLEGAFESTAVVPENNGENMLYCLVKRTINGVERRYIERLHSRRFYEVEDAFFVDSGLTYDDPKPISGATKANPIVITANSHGFNDGDEVIIANVEGMTELNGHTFKINNSDANSFELQTPVTTPEDVDGTGYNVYEEGGVVRKKISKVNNLHHLEGQTVSIFSDGRVDSQEVVTDGEVQFNLPGGRVHVGLPIEADLVTLPMAMQIEAFGQGFMKSVTHAYFRVKDSRGLLVGPDFDHLSPYIQRTTEPYGFPTEMITSEIEVALTPGWNRAGQTFIRQRDPVPTTILSMALEVQLGG